MSARRPLGKLHPFISFLRISSHLILNAIDAQQALVPGLMGCPQPLASRIMIAGSNECRNTHLRRERTWLDQILVQDQVPIRWTSLRAMERVVAYSTPWLHRRGLLVSCLRFIRIRFSITLASHTFRQEGCPRTGCTRCAREALLQGGKCASVQHSGKKQFQFQEGWARSECIQSRDRYYKTCSTSL